MKRSVETRERGALHTGGKEKCIRKHVCKSVGSEQPHAGSCIRLEYPGGRRAKSKMQERENHLKLANVM